MRRTISTVVTDVDNTLYDWVDLWYRSFTALLDCIASNTGLDRNILEQQMRRVFQTHGTSEYAYVLHEVPILAAQFPQVYFPRLYTDSLAAFREAYLSHLRLYPTVLSTFTELKERGCCIVAYTESMSFYTVPRLKKLGLDGVLDYLFSPPDHEPTQLALESLQGSADSDLTFEYSKAQFTPTGEFKPNPEVLMDILRKVGATPENTVYVGDSLMKDIAMAQYARVADVYAKYGAAQDLPEYALLRRLSHWTDEDVERERRIYERGEVEPSFVLQHAMSEMLKMFNFSPIRTI